MIPDEAVQAMKAVFDGKPPRGMRAALAAAAPHLMAQGWDEAVTTLYMGNAINQDHMKTMWTQNPYRKPSDAV